jgi:hypothetical protein
VTTRPEVRDALTGALAAEGLDPGATLYADALLPVVAGLAAEAYGQGRDDEATDVLSSAESAAHRWWQT